MAPVITFTTDFGLADAYVAAMKAAALRHCPDARLIDVTHLVPPQDVIAGGFALERAIAAFDPSTVHVAVIDPGVGSDRRMLVVEIAGQRVVCPDNGLITWAWRRQGGGVAHELTWRPPTASQTFHGRDIMAPVAGMLAAGTPMSTLSVPIASPILLDLAPASADRGQVIHIDHFGNATTNILAAYIAQRNPKQIALNGQPLGPLRQTYADVAEGEPLVLIGSSDLLEIAVRNASAARQLSISIGDPVELLNHGGTEKEFSHR